jgi:HSP20 family molecular chaperone IbpA
MKTQAKNEFTSYPGKYSTKLTVKEIQDFFKHIGTDKIKKPTTHIVETENQINVKIMIPGVRKEEIYTDIIDDRLYIYVLPKIENEPKDQLKDKEYVNDCLHCEIDLPNESDTSFIHSHYKDGILMIRIPKSKDRIKLNNRGIVIY